LSNGVPERKRGIQWGLIAWWLIIRSGAVSEYLQQEACRCRELASAVVILRCRGSHISGAASEISACLSAHHASQRSLAPPPMLVNSLQKIAYAHAEILQAWVSNRQESALKLLIIIRLISREFKMLIWYVRVVYLSSCAISAP
jgi:hypothetical protein